MLKFMNILVKNITMCLTRAIIYDKRRKSQKMVPRYLIGETLYMHRVATHLGYLFGIVIVNFITICNATRDLDWRTNYVMAKFFFVQVIFIPLCFAPILPTSMNHFCGNQIPIMLSNFMLHRVIISGRYGVFLL